MLAPTPGMEVGGQFVHLLWVVMRYGGLTIFVKFHSNPSTGSAPMLAPTPKTQWQGSLCTCTCL